MKHKIMLEKLCSQEELAKIDSDLFKDDKKLLDELIKQKIAMLLDWKYEPPQDIKQFIENRINALGLKPISLKVEQLETEFATQENNTTGDFIPFVFENLEKQLKKSKARIVLFETYGDSYVIFITDNKSAKNLTKIKSDFWQFSMLSRANNAVMYQTCCPNCNCRDLWILPIENRPPYEGGNLKIEEPKPYEQDCYSCHHLYWDKNGKVAEGVKIKAEECYDGLIASGQWKY